MVSYIYRINGMKPLLTKSEILTQSEVSDKCFLLTARVPAVAVAAVPGQFAMLKVSRGADPLLRRPISIHSVSGGTVSFLYEVVGPGTDLLSRMRPGDEIECIGPLGTGFDVKAAVPSRKHMKLPVLVAGGIGVAPLFFLAKEFKKAGAAPLVFIGARTKPLVLCAKEFRKLGCEVCVATDDGSAGFHGRVTALLEATISHEPLFVYACGPRPMLSEIARIAAEDRYFCQVSLEAHMACGIGACLGCVVNTQSGFKRVCKDGPVFDSQEIIW